MGRYFCAYTGDKESRAVRCVNALQGIPDYVVESAWFRQLIIQLSTNNYQSAIEQAKRNIRKEIDVTEMLLEATDKHDARNKLKGRLAGLRHALRNIRHNPVDVHV